MKTLFLLLALGPLVVRADEPQAAIEADAVTISDVVRNAARAWRSVGLYKGSTLTGEQKLEVALFGKCKPSLNVLSPTMIKVLVNPNDKSGNLYCIRIDFGERHVGDGSDLIQSAEFSSRTLYLGGENYQKVRISEADLFPDGFDTELEFTLSQFSEACRTLTDYNNQAEQGGSGQPATAPESKPEGGEKPKLEPKPAPR